MKNFSVLALYMVFLSFPALSMECPEPPIFSHISQSNLAGVAFEMDLNQDWAKLKNGRNSSPLRYAIRLKNIAVINLMLSAGARVTKEDVTRAMEVFKLGRKTEPNKLPNLISEARPMILAAKANEKPEQNLKLLGEVIHLFTRKKDLIKDLFDLHAEDALTKRETQIFLKYFVDSYVLDRDELSNEHLAWVISQMCALSIPRISLCLIMYS